MKLDRNTRGQGKYTLILNRKLVELREQSPTKTLPADISMAIAVLKGAGLLDASPERSQGEFFVIRLRDVHARDALMAYAKSANLNDPEYTADVLLLANRAGPRSPFCKVPD